jgi:hypothetical protein
MYKSIFLLPALIISGLIGTAKPGDKLNFSKNGEFKIVQFTDTHIELADKLNLEVYETVQKVISYENPDFVILTGDIVTEDNPQEAFRRFATIFEKAGIPWAMVFGNHESEHNFPRKALAAFLEKLPLCANSDRGETHGNSNFVLPVYGKENKPAALLYCMDSNEYSTLEPVVEGWGWFDFSQVGWYREQSRKNTHSNNGKPLPAVAFFHIPLPEYTDAWNNKAVPPIGVKNEDECSPEINTGMFAAMLECGDVMGTFVGHDHINDYIGIDYGIALAYGRVTKTSSDSTDPGPGGRVIVMKEGTREFDTWIREAEGKKVLKCTYPDSFVPAKKEKSNQ